jgi:hypothetical protein
MESNLSTVINPIPIQTKKTDNTFIIILLGIFLIMLLVGLGVVTYYSLYEHSGPSGPSGTKAPSGPTPSSTVTGPSGPTPSSTVTGPSGPSGPTPSTNEPSTSTNEETTPTSEKSLKANYIGFSSTFI